MKRRIVTLILAACLLLSLTPAAFADFDASAARHGVAYITVGMDLNGRWLGIGSGSGFFVGRTKENPQFMVTNNHVIDAFVTFGSGEAETININTWGARMLDFLGVDQSDANYDAYVEMLVGIWVNYVGQRDTASCKARIQVYFDSDDHEEAYLVERDSIKDLALLKLAEPTDKRAALRIMIPTDEMVGATVYAVGYPGIADNEIMEPVSIHGENDASVVSGTLSRLFVRSGSGTNAIQTNANIMHGNSGGPMLHENGAVIGVNSWGVSNGSGEEESYAVNIAEVTPLLERNHVDYEPVTLGSGEGGSTLYIAVAAVAAVAVAVFLVLKKKKSPAPVPDDAPLDPDDTGFRLQAVSGALQGKRFRIRRSGSITMGRDPSACSVVFPANTAGVSGRHCMVWFENGAVYVRDLGSSHGTFVQGRKLAAQESAQLPEGATFYLGAAGETFVIAKKQ